MPWRARRERPRRRRAAEQHHELPPSHAGDMGGPSLRDCRIVSLPPAGVVGPWGGPEMF